MGPSSNTDDAYRRVDRSSEVRYDGLLIGYARVSTEEQDLTAQREGLALLGVEPSRSMSITG